MVLADSKMRRRINNEHEEMNIEPYNEENLQPASYDLRLGVELKILDEPSRWYVPDFLENFFNRFRGDNSTENEETVQRTEVMKRGDTYTLQPQEFILAHTHEVVSVPNDLVGTIHGRSSWARIGVDPHLGGYIDPGYEGQITLEISNERNVPVDIKVGQRFCQIAFHEVSGRVENPYNGKYQGDYGAQTTKIQEEDDF